jgi:hypothetical protein
MRRMHEFVLINGKKIDVELAPLIRQIWGMHIETIACCQEVPEKVPANNFGPGYAWIRFNKVAGYAEFMRFKCRDPKIKELFFQKGNFLIKMRHWREPKFKIGCDLYFKKELIPTLSKV